MNTLIVMAKAPVQGAVKTRLARQTSGTAAVSAYRQMLAILLRRVGRDPRWRTVLAVAPDPALNSAAFPAHLARSAQGRGDLGQRMQRQFDRHRNKGPAVVIGSDIPSIRAAHIAAAFRALRAHDAVIGPSDDGGYWLIGMGVRRRLAPFAGVRWSSPHTFADTVQGLTGARVAVLDALSDIDAAADWRAWTQAPPSARFRG